MTKVFAILFLNIWHNIPHRLSASAITVLVSISALTLSGAVFADSSSQIPGPFATHHSSVLQTRHSALAPPTLPPLHHHYYSPKHTSTDNDTATTNTPTAQSTPAQTPTTTNSSSTVNTTGEPATTTQNNIAPSQSASVQLAQAQTTCNQGQTTYSIASATLATTSPLASGSTITWHWEARNDSGTSDVPPISSNPVAQTTATSSSSVALTATDPAQPLLSTTTSSTYAYSFRLVVTGLVSVTSNWVSIPESSTSC